LVSEERDMADRTPEHTPSDLECPCLQGGPVRLRREGSLHRVMCSACGTGTAWCRTEEAARDAWGADCSARTVEMLADDVIEEERYWGDPAPMGVAS